MLIGMTRREVARRFDAILEFAGLERFVDQQLKNYSSGMLLRLAYSVAIQVPFDILLLDEALAVGDADFQEKCFETFERDPGGREDGRLRQPRPLGSEALVRPRALPRARRGSSRSARPTTSSTRTARSRWRRSRCGAALGHRRRLRQAGAARPVPRCDRGRARPRRRRERADRRGQRRRRAAGAPARVVVRGAPGARVRGRGRSGSRRCPRRVGRARERRLPRRAGRSRRTPRRRRDGRAASGRWRRRCSSPRRGP